MTLTMVWSSKTQVGQNRSSAIDRYGQLSPPLFLEIKS